MPTSAEGFYELIIPSDIHFILYFFYKFTCIHPYTQAMGSMVATFALSQCGMGVRGKFWNSIYDLVHFEAMARV